MRTIVDDCYTTHQNTRYSDSSHYDEVCLNCGLTDNLHATRNMDNTPCRGWKKVYQNENI